MATQSKLRALRMLQNTPNTTACEHEVGSVQLAILTAIEAHPEGATLKDVARLIYKSTGDTLDFAQAYITVKSLQKNGRGWVVNAGKQLRPGPKASDVYVITANGKAAIESKLAHMKRQSAFVSVARTKRAR